MQRSVTYLAASFAFLAAVAMPMSAEEPTSKPALPPLGRGPSCSAQKLSPPAKLAGDLTDPVWAKATELAMNDAFTGMAIKPKTQGYIFCTDDALYIGFRCQEPAMDGLVTTGTIWARDSVEVFIEPKQDLREKPYSQITLDVAGNTEFSRMHNYPYPKYFNLKYAEEKWSPKIEVATAKGKDGWTAELRLPYSEFKFDNEVRANKSLWRLNVYRNRPARGREPAINWGWAPTGMKSYHMPGRFGLLLVGTFINQDSSEPLVFSWKDLNWAKPADDAFVAKVDAAVKNLAADDKDTRERAADELIALAKRSISGPVVVSQRVTAAARPLYGSKEKMPAVRRVLDYCNLAALENDDDPPPAEIRSMVDDFAAIVYKDAAGKTLPYRFLKPAGLDAKDTSKKYPLVLFMHGSGETGGDNRRQLADGSLFFNRKENRQKYPCFVVAPQCPLADSWFDMSAPGSREQLQAKHYYKLSDTPTEPMRLALELLDSLMKECPQIDPDRVYVSGASLGGLGTYEAVMRRPGFFAAAAPIAGGGDADQAKNIAGVAFNIFHGEKDANVSFECAKVMYDALKSAGCKVELTMYPGAGHGIMPLDDPKYLEWMFAQKRTEKSNRQ